MHDDKRDRDRFIGTAAQSDADELTRTELRFVEGHCTTCDGSPWDAASSTWCPTCEGKRARPCALCSKTLSPGGLPGDPCTRCGGSGFEVVRACKCGATYTDSPSSEHVEGCTRGAFQKRIEDMKKKHGEKVPTIDAADHAADHGARMKAASAGLTHALARCVSVLVETAMHLEGIDVAAVRADGPDHPAWKRVKVAHDIEASRFAVIVDDKQATPWHGFLIGVNDENGQIEGVFVPMVDESDDTEPPPAPGEEGDHLVAGFAEGLGMAPTRTIEGRCRKCSEPIFYADGAWTHRHADGHGFDRDADCYAEPMPEA